MTGLVIVYLLGFTTPVAAAVWLCARWHPEGLFGAIRDLAATRDHAGHGVAPVAGNRDRAGQDGSREGYPVAKDPWRND